MNPREPRYRTLADMAILAALFAFGSRFVGKILTTALGWASTLLFGRVPASRQYLLLGITFGSVIWIVLLAGVLFPDVGTFLLLFIPDQDIVPDDVIQLDHAHRRADRARRHRGAHPDALEPRRTVRRSASRRAWPAGTR